MPDFAAVLIATAVFCLAVVALNAITRIVLTWPIAPQDLAENGFAQFGTALILARASYRRLPTSRHA